MRPLKAICALSHLAGFLRLASAAKLAFDTPHIDTTQTDDTSGLPYFVQGNGVTVSWWTLFDNTTLTVNQALGNGTILWELLAINWPKSRTEVQWTVDGIGNHSIAGSKFYFFLQNGNNEYCDACNLTSSHFVIKSKAEVAATATTSSLSTTSTSEPKAHTKTTDAASPSTATVAHAVRPMTPGNRAIQLGVGLGAGIPALFALILIFFLWARHHRRKRQLENPEMTKQSSSSESLAPEAVAMSEKSPVPDRDRHLSRESGALGPYAENPSPTWEQQEAREQEEQEYMQQQQQFYHQHGHRRGSSSRRMAFRPSLGAHSEVSDESSRHSWIDEFDFERPGYQESDEMSQVQRSIQDAPSSQGSYHTPSKRSHSSILNVADIPDVPQPAHHWYSHARWQ